MNINTVNENLAFEEALIARMALDRLRKSECDVGSNYSEGLHTHSVGNEEDTSLWGNLHNSIIERYQCQADSIETDYQPISENINQYFECLQNSFDKYISARTSVEPATQKQFKSILDNSIEGVTFRNKDSITAFLDQYPEITTKLFEARENILKFFPNHSFALEVMADPENEDDPQLILYIQTTLSPDEAIERLDKFDDEWWLDVDIAIQEKVCLTVEYL